MAKDQKKILVYFGPPYYTSYPFAKNDAYYPQLDTIAKAEEMWPGCEVIAYDNLGHVE